MMSKNNGSLLMQYICTASDMCEELTKTHKRGIKRETGETIFFPKEYDNYEVFKAKYVTNLLAERLKILSEFKDLYDQWKETKELPEKYLTHRKSLDINENLLRNNLEGSKLNEIFGETYDRQGIKPEHIITVASVLKERLLPEDVANQAKLAGLIQQIQSWNQKEGKSFMLGESSILGSNISSEQRNKTE